jgi:hypothetical protein
VFILNLIKYQLAKFNCPSTQRKIFMKINTANATPTPSATAKKAVLGTYEKNAKEFGPVAASIIGVGSSAIQASNTLGKAVSSVENEIKDVATQTVALATDGVNEIKSAYNKVSTGLGNAASAVAGYAETGVSAGVQALSALV